MQDLGKNSTQTKHHRRPEQRVIGYAEDGLDTADHHLLHQHALDPRVGLVGLRVAHDLVEGQRHRGGGIHAEPHRARLGFMRNIRRLHFQHHRIAQRARRLDRRCCIRYQYFTRHTDAIIGQCLLGKMFRPIVALHGQLRF